MAGRRGRCDSCERELPLRALRPLLWARVCRRCARELSGRIGRERPREREPSAGLAARRRRAVERRIRSLALPVGLLLALLSVRMLAAEVMRRILAGAVAAELLFHLLAPAAGHDLEPRVALRRALGCAFALLVLEGPHFEALTALGASPSESWPLLLGFVVPLAGRALAYVLLRPARWESEPSDLEVDLSLRARRES